MPFGRPRLIKSIIACAVGAIAGTAPAVWLFELFFFYGMVMEDPWGVFWGLSPMVLIMSAITLAGMLLIGLPAHYRMRKAGKTGYWDHVKWTILAGLFIPCLFIIGIFFAPFGALAGFIAGSVFWLIRRPDRDAPALETPVFPASSSL